MSYEAIRSETKDNYEYIDLSTPEHKDEEVYDVIGENLQMPSTPVREYLDIVGSGEDGTTYHNEPGWNKETQIYYNKPDIGASNTD